jgi:hypothetical protein
MWKILLFSLLIVIANETFMVRYTGHVIHWTDYGMNSNSPIRATWTQTIDSSWAELDISASGRYRPDTIIFRRLSNSRWKITSFNNDTSIRSSVDAEFVRTKDSIIISLGFGFSGVMYYLKNDL